MNREFYHNIAKQHKRMVFGVDLILHEKPEPEKILLNGEELGKVIIETSELFDMNLAMPFMDLNVEKLDMLNILGIPETDLDSFHFNEQNLNEESIEIVKNHINNAPVERLKANCEAISFVADHSGLLPVGMCIGPFSFITKLLSDPISPVFLSSVGISASEDESVKILELALEVATLIIIRSIKMQIAAGAKAICVCEPAANNVYISPDTLTEDGNDAFDRLVINYNKRIKAVLDENNTDLILHDCGELTDVMVQKLCKLDPVILSLGSSRNLWEDAKFVPKNVVLFGNLPTKKFFMDNEVTLDKVKVLTQELEKKMAETGHPFILGSECDVLSVKGYEEIIRNKINLMLSTKK